MADSDDAPRRRTVICDFCKTKLTADGEIVKLGAEAIEARDALQSNTKLREQLTAAEQLVKDLRAELKTLKDGKAPAAADDDDDV